MNEIYIVYIRHGRPKPENLLFQYDHFKHVFKALSLQTAKIQAIEIFDENDEYVRKIFRSVSGHFRPSFGFITENYCI